ncbi:putative hydrolase [Pullulanibacillus camelliae]|uniref:Putative hydrolase n=1 Tax=Pullulanibacillus camelliae TaxID=1707096 RepID=A0A8J2YBC0_9BACL|nr:M20 family metallo-hydrolase [Pullulanibacillus camelliae]GGE27544.1 putative hydrolase [Pullulanibacillus camelliae]
MNVGRIEKTLKEINQIGYSEKGMNRLAYTAEELQAKKLVMARCRQEKMHVRMDEAGNVIARREGRLPHLAPVGMGSHIDTVYDGGRFDGTVGIVAALEVVRRLNEKNIVTQRPIELMIFSAEESSRFGMATIGSKIMAGLIRADQLKHLTDRKGVTFKRAVEKVGLDISTMDKAIRTAPLHAFYEIHIEQGPILEKEKLPIGIVTTIAAPTRFRVTIKGKAAHSGTTPMHMRQDALMGAVEVAKKVEESARRMGEGTVATVGDLKVSPGAMNVIPGAAELLVDIRGQSKKQKQEVIHAILRKFEQLEMERRLEVAVDWLADNDPVLLNRTMITQLIGLCEQDHFSYKTMASGAGHDAMNMASLCPTGLIFIPCKDGLSHHKDEETKIESIEIAVRLLEKAVLQKSEDVHEGAYCKGGTAL